MRIFLFLLLLPILLFASIDNVATIKGSVVIQHHEASFGGTSVPGGRDQMQQNVLIQESHHTLPQPQPLYPTGATGGSNRGI
jgi:hypothetical protein